MTNLSINSPPSQFIRFKINYSANPNPNPYPPYPHLSHPSEVIQIYRDQIHNKFENPIPKPMNPKSPSQAQLDSNQSVYYEQLHQRIDLSNQQLLELTQNDQQFISQIRQLNEIGVAKLQTESYKEALVYLNQSEKILEYAASCGKAIDQSIIIATLHNEACVHQKLWDLEKSANYLQAIIYNIENGLEISKIRMQQMGRGKGQEELSGLLSYLKKQQNYALYNLQFCAVNSQIRRHHVSVKAAKIAISTMKQVLKITQLLTETNKTNSINLKMIKQLIQSDQQLLDSNYEGYLSIVRKFMILLLKRNQQAAKNPDIEHLKSFSIGKLMQLTPVQIENCNVQKTCEQQLKYQSLLLKVLYMGISYFTVGTQLRFISSQNQQISKNQNSHSPQQFLKSQLYHLYAIKIILAHVPIQTVFLNHLITSFKNHYGIDFLGEAQAYAKNNQDNLQPETPIISGGLSQFGNEAEYMNCLPQQSHLKTEEDVNPKYKSKLDTNIERHKFKQRKHRNPLNSVYTVSPPFSDNRRQIKSISKQFKNTKRGIFIKQIDFQYRNTSKSKIDLQYKSSSKSRSKRDSKSNKRDSKSRGRLRLGNNYGEDKASGGTDKRYCIYTMKSNGNTNASNSNGKNHSQKSNKSKPTKNAPKQSRLTKETHEKFKQLKKLSDQFNCLKKQGYEIQLTHGFDTHKDPATRIQNQHQFPHKQRTHKSKNNTKNKSNDKPITMNKVDGMNLKNRK